MWGTHSPASMMRRSHEVEGSRCRDLSQFLTKVIEIILQIRIRDFKPLYLSLRFLIKRKSGKLEDRIEKRGGEEVISIGSGIMHWKDMESKLMVKVTDNDMNSEVGMRLNAKKVRGAGA